MIAGGLRKTRRRIQLTFQTSVFCAVHNTLRWALPRPLFRIYQGFDNRLY
jgi:hypothetical protein